MPWALVTGGSSEIGAAICVRLAQEGYDVAVHTFRDTEAAEHVAGKVAAEGRKAIVLRAHLGKDGSCAALAAACAEQVGAIDVFINNAASGVFRDAAELTERHLDWMFAVNARPMLTLTTALRPRVAIAMTNPAAQHVLPSFAGLGAAKAALEALVRYLAVELAPLTRVNAVCPAAVRTEAMHHISCGSQLVQDSTSRTPLGRDVLPEDVAAAVAWLSSGESAMVNGHTLVIDGGRTLLLS